MRGFSYVLDVAIKCIGKAFTLLGVVAIVASLHWLLVLLYVALVAAQSIIEAKTKEKQADLSMQIVEKNRHYMHYAEVFEDYTFGKEIRLGALSKWLMQREKEHGEHVYSLNRAYSRLDIRAGA